MSRYEPIQITLQQEFHSERLIRIIKECDDLAILREIALQLVNLNQKNTAIAKWSAKRAMKAEQDILNNKNI